MSEVKWGRTAILALVLFILGSIVYWHEFKHKPSKEESEAQSKKLFQLKDAQISIITLSDGSRKFVFRCDDLASKLCKPGSNPKWDLVEPVKAKADETNVNSLVSSLDQLTSSESISLKDETAEKKKSLLQEYGLSEEKRTSGKRIEVETESP